MADHNGTLGTIADAAASLLRPLDERVEGGDLRVLLADLGLSLPASVDGNAALVAASKSLLQRLQDLPSISHALATAIKDENIAQILAKALELAAGVLNVVKDVEKLGTAIKGLPGTGIPAPELNAFAEQLPTRLIDYLVVRNLEGIPGLGDALDFIGFVERADVPAADAQHPPFTRRAIHVDQLTKFLTDSAAHLKAKYQWGDPAFTGLPLLQKLAALLGRAGVPAILDATGPAPVLDVVFLEIRPKLDEKALTLRIAHPLDVDTAQPWVQDDWQLKVLLNTKLDIGVEVVIRPDDGVTLTPVGTTPVQGDLALEWTGGKPDGPPYLILGEPGGSRVEAKQLVARAGVGFAWNAAANRGEGALKISALIKGGKFAISLANADGFLGKILGGFGLESEFDVGLGYSTRDGVFFAGSATLDIQLPLHVQLGPVEISALTLTVGFAGNTFPIGLRTDIKAALGPLQGLVEQIGIGVDLSFPNDRKGNAGPVDFKLKFLPPKGIALSLDVGVVKGGGYLFIDPDRGEYAGALELSLFGVVTIKAIGIISTKLPDGSKGFSLIIIMSVEFAIGIQLGFGFTLLAVGGLFGLNRTAKLDALAAGIRSGAIESVMFPRDIIANAPKIISDLRAFFAPEEGKFLIGPMVKLGWGTPTLVSLSLGIIMEIPGNIAIVGVLQVALPTADAPLIRLQVNFIGAIEFDRKRIWFFAALYDSRIVFLTIDGEMGLLLAFGDDANFVISVGGFHPQFSPPPLPFPSPRRVAVSLRSTPISRINIEAYFAVTSNTVQFGARVELMYGLDILNIRGNLAFDALFQLSPFFFIIELSASLSVNVFGAGVFCVSIGGSLKGPAAWSIDGHGLISLLFWDVDVDFATTWGEERREELPPIRVLDLLGAEIKKAENWRAFLPAGTSLRVSLRKMPAAEAALFLHPVGVLRVSQRALPLQLTLDKVGSRKPEDVNRVSLSVVSGGLQRKNDAFEQFAPAQYQNFSDADKLSKPAFAPERGGLELSAAGADLRSSYMVRRVVLYEEIILDSNYKRFARRFTAFFGSLFVFFLNGSAAARCDVSQATRKKLQPFDDKITVGAETYTVALQANNRPVAADAVSFHTEASAREYLNARLAADPGLADAIHVIPSIERAA
jgi:hypothetical protein